MARCQEASGGHCPERLASSAAACGRYETDGRCIGRRGYRQNDWLGLHNRSRGIAKRHVFADRHIPLQGRDPRGRWLRIERQLAAEQLRRRSKEVREGCLVKSEGLMGERGPKVGLPVGGEGRFSKYCGLYGSHSKKYLRQKGIYLHGDTSCG